MLKRTAKHHWGGTTLYKPTKNPIKPHKITIFLWFSSDYYRQWGPHPVEPSVQKFPPPRIEGD